MENSFWFFMWAIIAGVFAGYVVGVAYGWEFIDKKRRAVFDYYDDLGLAVDYLEKRINGTYQVHFANRKESVVKVEKDKTINEYKVTEKVQPFVQ